MASKFPDADKTLTAVGAINCNISNSTVIAIQYNTGKVGVDEIQKRTLETIESETKDTVEPSSLKVVLEMIKNGSPCVTITGSPGEGKSTLGYLVLRRLQETRNVFEVSSPSQFDEIIKTSAPVVLLDDIFGQTIFDQMAWRQWKKSIERFINNAKAQKTKNELGNLILIGRDFVLKSGARQTEHPWKMLVNNANVVNISSESLKRNDDKVQILNSIAKKLNVQLNDATIETICSIKTPHGFPHTCKLFMLYKENSIISVEDFFGNPIEFLRDSLQILMIERVDIEHIFIEMIKGDGHVLNSELSQRGYKYETTAKDLCPTYIKPERDGYVFDHPSILDTVALLFCETKLSFILAHCSMKFILERVWLVTPDGKKRGETGAGVKHLMEIPLKLAGAKLMTEIPWNKAKELARRFGEELAAGNYWDVRFHNAWKSDMFVQLVIQSMSVKQLNVYDREGETLLDNLCDENRADCVKVCGQKAYVNIQNKEGCTALLHSAMRGRTEVVSVLLECGADVNCQDKKGGTALQWAVKDGSTELVSMLLECRVDVNCQDKAGSTALHWGALYGRTELVSALLECGADVNIRNRSGDTALDWATELGQNETVSFLREAGSRTT